VKIAGNVRSIVAMLVAVGFFSLMDAVMKTLAATYPAMQVAALRGLAALPLVCLYVVWRQETRALLRIRWPLHLVRGVLTVLMLWLFAMGINALALTEAYTIFFISPLLITLLSVPVLKETVRPLHWLAIGVGLLGVLVAMRPDGEAFLSLGALTVLASAGCYAVSVILARIVSRTDSSVSVVFWTTAMMALGAGLLAAPHWIALSRAHWPLIAALAVTGFIGQLAITEAFQHGQASAVAPFEYTALAWAIGLDWVLWRTVPDHYTLLGGAIIMGSGLYLIRKERVQDVTLPP
jgi:drug/metabolite transporter (DMT)-like permease